MRDIFKKIIDRLWHVTAAVGAETIRSRSEKPFEHNKVDFKDPEVNISYSADNTKWIHSEYVIKLKNVIVEPQYAYCIQGFNKLVSSTVLYPSLLPSFPRYIVSFLKKKPSYKTAVLFDGDTGTNYFHFFSDIINKIWLLKMLDNYKSLPLIIGSKTFHTKFFQYLFKHTEIGNLNWVVLRDNEYLKVEEMYLLKPMPYERSYFLQLKELLGVKPLLELNKRVFLNRSFKAGRYIENFEEIRPILTKYKFEITDTADIDFRSQIDLFNSTKYLIGIHGAGNTNIIFANRQLRFLEINPSTRICGQYYWLSSALGIDYYDIITGGTLNVSNDLKEHGFYLDPQKLEDAVKRMLAPEDL